jgi:hypothetical protein
MKKAAYKYYVFGLLGLVISCNTGSNQHTKENLIKEILKTRELNHIHFIQEKIPFYTGDKSNDLFVSFMLESGIDSLSSNKLIDRFKNRDKETSFTWEDCKDTTWMRCIKSNTEFKTILKINQGVYSSQFIDYETGEHQTEELHNWYISNNLLMAISNYYTFSNNHKDYIYCKVYFLNSNNNHRRVKQCLFEKIDNSLFLIKFK